MTVHHSVLRLSKRLWLFLPLPGIIALTTHLLSLSQCAYPGYSTALAAAAAGLIPPSNASHPLFALAARGIASLDVFSLLIRLNLFSAFCGAICAMLLYHLVSRTILFSACEDAGGGGRNQLVDDDSDESEMIPELPPEVDLYNQRVLRIALAGGLAAAFLFTFMAPTWSAATRLDAGLFDLLLALVSLSLFPMVTTPFHLPRLAMSVFLFVLGLFDSAVFLLLLPCYAFFTFNIFWFSLQRRAMFFLVIVAGVAGTAFSIFAFCQNTDASSAATLLNVLVSYARGLPFSHYRELRSFFPNSGWALVLVQTGLPAVILLFGQQLLFKEKRLNTVMAALLVTVAVAPGLLNLSISPFHFFQLTNHLPVFGYAIIAVASASVISACLILIRPDDISENSDVPGDLDSTPQGCIRWVRGLAAGILAFFLVLVLATPFLSFRDVDARRGAFADQFAREMLDAMKDRTCLISNGLLDNQLLIQAFLMKRPLTLISLRFPAFPRDVDRIRQFIAASPIFEGQNRQRLQNALSIGTDRFVLEWFNTDKNAGRRAMVFATPDVWLACGYRAVPEGLAFGGIRADQAVDSEGLVEQNRAFVARVAPLFVRYDKEFGHVAFLRELLRRKVGFAANELGVLLEDLNDFKAADQSYARAMEVDPINISAAINEYALASTRGLHPEALDAMKKKIKTVLENMRGSKTQKLTAILQNFGSVRQQAFYQQQTAMWSALGASALANNKISKALTLSKQTGVSALVENAGVYLHMGDTAKAEACYLSALAEDASNADALSGMCTLMVSKNNVQAAEMWVQKALNAGIEKERLGYQIVMLALLKKDMEHACELLKEATRKYPTDLRYWTLLADVLLERGDTQVVEFQVLPDMQKALQNPAHFLVYAIRGCLLKKKGPKFYKEARLALLNALSLNAALPEIWSAVFELDTALNNPAFTETDARNLLNVDPDHALANYLLGSLLLVRGALPESEDFLRRSIEKKPTAEACNDLAENLRLQKKLAEAEAFARQALELDHGLLPAKDTLACILLDAGKYGESSRLAAQAVEARPNYPTYQLTLLRAQVKMGDKDGVSQRLRFLAESNIGIPDSLQKEIEKMK